MTYQVTVSGTTFSVSYTAPTFPITITQLAESEITTKVSQAQAAQAAAETAQTGAETAETGAQTAETNAAGSATAAALEAANAAANSSGQDLSGLSETLGPSAILGAVIYDTALDSDGGAWRFKCGWTSWEREDRPTGPYLGTHTDAVAAVAANSGISDFTGAYYHSQDLDQFIQFTDSQLNVAIIYRGSDQQFPAKALITFEAGRVIIWNALTGAMFWVSRSSSATSELGVLRGLNAYSVTAISARKGEICIGLRSDSLENQNEGLHYLNFAGDYAGKIGTDATKSGRVYPLSDYHSQDITPDANSPLLVNVNVLSLAQTVLPDAPINPETGLPYVTTVVGTEGGLTILDGPAGVGTAVDITHTAGTGVISFLEFRSDGALLYASDNSFDGKWFHVRHSLPTSDLSEGNIISKGTSDEFYRMVGGAGDMYLVPIDTFPRTVALADTAIGRANQINFLYPNPSSPSDGAQVIMQDDNISPVMHGGTLFAGLASTDDTDLVGGTIEDRSPNADDLTNAGTATRTKVATGADLVWFNLSADSTVTLDSDISSTGMVCWWQDVSGTPTFYCRDLSGGQDYVNNIAGTAPTTSQTFSGADMTVKASIDMALLTADPAPLSEQQRTLKYNIERWWFQPDAVVTLDTGTVRHVAFDKALNQYHVVTSGGHSVFDARTLTRISFTSGDWDWVTADNGSVVKGD